MSDAPTPAQVDVQVFWMSLDTVEATPTESTFPYARWAAQATQPYSPSGAHVKRKRRGKRDELLFLRP